jgi:hypothetical protein
LENLARQRIIAKSYEISKSVAAAAAAAASRTAICQMQKNYGRIYLKARSLFSIFYPMLYGRVINEGD